MDTNADHNLISRCREGDEEAWRQLLTRYEAYVYRLCYKISGSREDALDLTQEALLKVLTGLARFQPGLPFKPWLLRIAVNRCLNEQRRRAPQTVPFGPGHDPACQGPTPEGTAMRRDTQSAIRQAIAALEDDQRLAVMLRYFAGLSVPDIAAVLSCPEGTVKSRLHRALAQLRVHLQELDVSLSR